MDIEYGYIPRKKVNKENIRNFKVSENLDEETLRKLYLRKIALGELQGPMTNKASENQPWLKFCTEEDIAEAANKMTCYDELYEYNKDHMDEVAIEYFGREITYKELFENIDKTAKAYTELGVKEGDIVTICSITTPEIIYSFYALNKIGAVSNLLDLRYTTKAIEKFVNEVNSKYFVTLDLAYPKIKDLVENTCVENNIIISPTNSVPPIKRAIANFANKLQGKQVNVPKNSHNILWNDFIENGKNTEYKKHEYKENETAAIVHTGGTTGVPKGVMLTNDNFNQALVQIKNSHAKTIRGDRNLNIMPPFIAYGIVLGLYSSTVLGWRTIVIPSFDANKFDDLLIKHKPNIIMGVPTYWETVMASKKMKNRDVSYVKYILLGGDRIKAEFEKRLDEFLKTHNCSAGVGKGYSMTEASACATFSSKIANKPDSVGIPLVKTKVAAFKPGTTEELGYGEIGELCIQTPTMMLGYYDREKETNDIIKEHKDGKWIHSGDLGYVDSDGIVFIKDRIKRMIPRSGFKVFPSELENLFLTHNAVKSCAVVGIPDPVDVTAPYAHIVLKEEYLGMEEQVEKELKYLFENSEVPPYFEPVGYKFRESIPVTDIGKVDFISLQNEYNQENAKQMTKKM